MMKTKTIGTTTRAGVGKKLLLQGLSVFGLLIIAFQSACSLPPEDERQLYPVSLPATTPTLLPPYLATEQSAQAGARATQVAAQAAGEEANLAQAYLLVTQTTVSLAMTSAAATEQYFIRQTEQAVQFTQTAQSMESAATQQAHQALQTATVQAQATQAAQTTATASISLTGTAWPQTATPLAATQIAIIAQAQETERRAYWRQYVIPFWVSIGAVLLLTCLILAVVTYRQLLPAFELRLRTRHSPDGETLILLDQSHKVNVLQPGRNFGAALLNRPEVVDVGGVAPDGAEWQDRVTGREQAVKLARALPPEQRRSARRLLSQTAPAQLPVGNGAVPKINILLPEDPRMRRLLDEAEQKLIGEGDD